MNAKIEKAKVKLCAVADKVENSKAYKAVEKVVVTAGAGLITAGTLAMNSFAADGAGVGTIVLAEINSGDVLNTAKPFINAGIPILAIVGGIKLGTRFLRGSMH